MRKGLTALVPSPFVGIVGVVKEVPYAKRREYTFDKKTDRLGRYYEMDPRDDTYGTVGKTRDHIMYLHRAVQKNIPLIMSVFKTSATLSVREIGAKTI